MQIDINHSKLYLARDGLVALRDGQGSQILCHDGALWVTQECDVKDTILGPGQSLTLSNRGLTLVSAIQPATLTLIEPARAKANVGESRTTSHARGRLEPQACP